MLDEADAWQNRPLDRVYPVVFIDAIVVKIRDSQVRVTPVSDAILRSASGTTDSGEPAHSSWFRSLSFLLLCDRSPIEYVDSGRRARSSSVRCA